jgi:hypothetical protein
LETLSKTFIKKLKQKRGVGRQTFVVIVNRKVIEILQWVRMVEGFALVFILGHVVVSASVAAPIGCVTVRGCIAIHNLAIVYRAKQKNKTKSKH